MNKTMQYAVGVLTVLALCLLSTAVWAGPAGFNLSGAIGVWYLQPGGDVENVDLDSDFKFDDKANLALWVRLEHPLPIVPDVKLDYATVKFDGGRLDSSIDLKVFDATAYWHVPMVQTLTNDMLDVTLGLGARFYDGDVDIQTFTGNLANNDVMPFVYAGARLEPIDWLAFAVEAKAWSAGGEKTFDGLAKVEVYPFIDYFFVGAGYRYIMLETDNSSSSIYDLNMDVKPGGFFLEVGFDI